MIKLYKRNGRHVVQYYRNVAGKWEYWSPSLGYWTLSDNSSRFFTEELTLLANNYRQK